MTKVEETMSEKLDRHIGEAEWDARAWAGSGLAAVRRRDAEILRSWLEESAFSFRDPS